MHLRKVIILLFASLLVAAVAPRAAYAQTLAATSLQYPDRILPDGTDLGTGPRAQNLTPLGVSYADCMQDQSLKFSVAVSGFTGGTDIQLWATKNGNCANDSERGSPGPPTCWPLPGGLASVNQMTTATYQFTVRVQDIIGPQNAVPNPAQYTRRGAEACTSQLSFSSQTFSVFFVPVQNGNNAVGMAYSYHLPVDLVGPPAPTGINDQVGDTLFTLTWTPNSDTDTTGYNVYMDPIPGHEGTAGSMDGAVATPEPILYCPDTGAPMATMDAGDSGDDGSADATADATADAASTPTPVDAGCYYINVGGPPTMSKCGDTVLAGGIVQDSGTTVVSSDDSGTVETGSGGISTIPSQYLVGASGAGLTISDKSVGTYTITGLKNEVTYSAVVSAVDGYGNIGPPSVEQCDYPAPVNDFWTDYRNAGGRAGGGFCALEAVGAPAGTSLAGVALVMGVGAVVRRRRRRSR
jgi:hypothetical protein